MNNVRLLRKEIEYLLNGLAQFSINGSCMPIQSDIHYPVDEVNKMFILFTKLQNGNTQKS